MNALVKKSQAVKLVFFGLCLYAVFNLVAMATMSISVAVLITLTVMAVGRMQPFLQYREYLVVSLILAAVCALSLILGQAHPVSYRGETAQFSFFKDYLKIWYLILPIIVAVGVGMLSEAQRRRVLQCWIATFTVLSLVGVAQYFTGWPHEQMIPRHVGGTGRYHVLLFLGHHLSVASIFIFPFFLTLEFIRRSKGPEEIGIPRKILIAIAIVGCLSLFLTFSRTLWIALPVGLVFWVWAQLPKKYRIGFVMLLALIGAGLTQVPMVRERFTYIHGIDQRTDLWKANWEFFLQRPLTGVGWRKTIELSGPYLLEKHPERSFVFSGHAHNNLIEMLGGTGALGVLAWLLWCGYGIFILYRWGKRAPERGLALGLLAAWIVFHINGMTQVNFWEGKVLHQMMWMTGWTLFWVKK